ncbi:uncharacterized protein HD556DRAFT_1535997 [Suillus plorans]|uniref:Uncharacterized protein n=1 Tax=Suillus plorans TaxID=116603 RepID=A0A9P7AR95_9AGAM|nr:uncharacterized protein HD556DRAFT_1535997 [Suillus plorans]KAG1794835.1 hypothetical protein HD556DRAFT_1535997 [Suillus plorans]
MSPPKGREKIVAPSWVATPSRAESARISPIYNDEVPIDTLKKHPSRACKTPKHVTSLTNPRPGASHLPVLTLNVQICSSRSVVFPLQDALLYLHLRITRKHRNHSPTELAGPLVSSYVASIKAVVATQFCRNFACAHAERRQVSATPDVPRDLAARTLDIFAANITLQHVLALVNNLYAALEHYQAVAAHKQREDVKTIATTTAHNACIDGDLSTDEELLMQDINTDANNHIPYILAITTSRIACVNGDLSTAEGLLTQDINTSPNNHTSYAHRSFVMARKCDWDHALLDAIKSIRIRPSLMGYISKGIALCGKGCILDARAAFDVASMYTDQDSEIVHFLLLIKAITLFNADQHDEANLLLKELAAGCPNANTLACGIVQAYLHVQLGIKALDGAHYDEATDHFTAAIDSSNLSSESDIHEVYEDLVVSYQHMMTSSDEMTKADCLDWSNDFKQECSALCTANGEAAFAASDYDKAIDLYSMAIDLGSASDVFFANCSQVKLSKMLWEDALLNARKPMLTSAMPLRGTQRYDEAIEAFTIMLSKLDDAPEAQIRGFALVAEEHVEGEGARASLNEHRTPKFCHQKTILL